MDVKQTIPPQGKALVYVVRPNRAGGLIKFKLHVDGIHVGTTKARQFLYSILNPGPHLFMSKAENRSEMQLNLEAGKTYFLKQKIKLGGIKARNELILVNEIEGREMLEKCKLGRQIEMLIPENTKPCVNCGKQIPEDVKFCNLCGAEQIEAEKPIPENTKPCINCGKQIPEEVKFCTHCGGSQIEAEKPIPANSKACISCGEQIDLDIEFCGHCGANQKEAKKPIPVDTKACISCGEQIELNIDVCPHCGVRQIPTIDR